MNAYTDHLEQLRAIVADMRGSADFADTNSEFVAERFLRGYADRIDRVTNGHILNTSP